MISSRRLLQIARKWRRLAALGRRRISWMKLGDGVSFDTISSSVPPEGTLVVYSHDGKRFVVPLEYINTGIFRVLFELSREEFGLSCDGPIMMPCDSVVMEYVISLIPRRVSREVEMALLSTLSNTRCSTTSVCSRGVFPHESLVHGC